MHDDVTTGSSDGTFEAARRLDADDLAYVNRMTTLGQVVPNAAHEINNALQIVGGLVELVSSKDLPPDVKDKLAKIGGQTARAVEIVHHVVAYIRREGAGAGRTDVRRAAEGALTLRRYHLSRAGVHVHVTATGDGPFVVAADAHSTQQIVLNLIVNAEQALTGREAGELRVNVARTGSAVALSVTDNGRGMSPAVAGRAFDAFYTTHREHAGLGLTVVRALAQRFEGAVRLTSEPGQGTIVTVELPAAG
ncbi:MAG: ATP-binding protein [Vicinamibacterales bacterium]